MNKTLSNLFKGDKVIWMVFFFLCLISIVEVFSASSQLSYKGGSYFSPVIKHIWLLLVGIVCMIVTLNIKCKYFKIVTPFMLLISILLLVLVWVLGEKTNGGARWLEILPGMSFQPSEIAKGTMVLATAQIFSAMQTPEGADKNAIKYVLWICAPIIPLIMVENFSTAALLSLVLIMMMFIGRVPSRQLGILMGVIALFVGGMLSLVLLVGNAKKVQNPKQNMTEMIDVQGQAASVEKKDEPWITKNVFHRFDTWKSRILSFVNKRDLPPDSVDLDKDAQVAHANIAIASSNVVGKLPGNSVERDFLSQAFSDFIFAIIIEEMGIEGAFIVAMLYIILLFRTGRIASRCENSFPAFLAMGLALLLATQALFNMCVAVGLAPVTGQPLPLISKGGTSTIINCVYIGVILSISRSAKKKDSAATAVKSAVAATA